MKILNIYFFYKTNQYKFVYIEKVSGSMTNHHYKNQTRDKKTSRFIPNNENNNNYNHKNNNNKSKNINNSKK